MNTPVILSYFSQSIDPDNPYLQYLQEEYRIIAEAWEAYQKTGSEKNINVLFPARGSADAAQIDNDIRNFKHRIVIFHFSGHAGSGKLLFSDGSAQAKGLAGLLGEAPNLKIVFLNGCATHDQVKLLFEKNIKAVIATKGKVNDGIAKEFSANFYAAVSTTDYTIKEAFEHAIHTLIKDGRISVDTPTSLTSWRGLDMEDEDDKDRWELYIKDGFNQVVDSRDWWKIGVIIPTRKEILTGGSFWDHSQVYLSILLFVLGLVIIGYGIFFENDFKIAAIGLASDCIALFGIKNHQRYLTAQANSELIDDPIRKNLKLF